MKPDMLAIEDMLGDYAKMLAEAVLRESPKRRETPPPETSAEAERQRADIEAHLANVRRALAAVRAHEGMVGERRRRDRGLFAGTFPPKDPVACTLLCSTLLADRDDPAMRDYLGDCEDWEDGEEPVMRAFFEAHERELALEPTTPEAAAAIYHAATRDRALGCGHQWDAGKVRRARRKAVRAGLLTLPRPR